MSKTYRSRTRLLMDLLQAVRDEGDATVTRLLFLANLSHKRLMEYLDELLTKGWVAADTTEGKRVWRITDSGRETLRELSKIDRFMDDFGLEL